MPLRIRVTLEQPGKRHWSGERLTEVTPAIIEIGDEELSALRAALTPTEAALAAKEDE